MNKNRVYLIVLLILPVLFFQSCSKDSCTEERKYTVYNPVYIPESALHPEISVEGPRSLEEPGKIYFYQDYIFINEIRKGIHIIDNAEPSSPNFVARVL